jgi:DNA uptake protein ComE-like DNA-binding protein
MSFGARNSSALVMPPRVAWRSAAGAGVVLLALQFPTLGRPASSASATIVPDQARLRLDPNVATREELMLLPRIGPVLADAIIEYRESAKPGLAFLSAEDLDHVPRIGPVTVEQLRPLLVFRPERVEEADTEARGP